MQDRLIKGGSLKGAADRPRYSPTAELADRALVRGVRRMPSLSAALVGFSVVVSAFGAAVKGATGSVARLDHTHAAHSLRHDEARSGYPVLIDSRVVVHANAVRRRYSARNVCGRQGEGGLRAARQFARCGLCLNFPSQPERTRRKELDRRNRYRRHQDRGWRC